MNDVSTTNPMIDRSLLIVDSEKTFVERFMRAMELRGYSVAVADSAKAGLAMIENTPPAYAVVDLRLGDGNGLELIAALAKRRTDARGLVQPTIWLNPPNLMKFIGPYNRITRLS